MFKEKCKGGLAKNPQKLTDDILKRLTERIREEAEKRASEKWESLLSKLQTLKTDTKTSWGIIGLGVLQLDKNLKEVPLTLIAEEREGVITDVLGGFPI
jgi:hypothetical protein